MSNVLNNFKIKFIKFNTLTFKYQCFIISYGCVFHIFFFFVCNVNVFIFLSILNVSKFLCSFIKINLTSVTYYLFVDFVIIIYIVYFHREEFTRVSSFWIRTVCVCVYMHMYFWEFLPSPSVAILLCQIGLSCSY